MVRTDTSKRTRKVLVSFTPAELDALRRVAGTVPAATWVRDVAVRATKRGSQSGGTR